MALSNEGFVFPSFAPLRRTGPADQVTAEPEKDTQSPSRRSESPERRSESPERRSESPEQRMKVFHAQRLAGAGEISLGGRRTEEDPADPNESEEERSLKVARAEAVEFIVKAFAAVDRNVALADKARLQQEENRAAAEKLRVEAGEELARARELREEAEREAENARSLAEGVLATARAESARIIEEAHARSRSEAESARRRIVESLGPLRDVIGLASGTLDAFVNPPGSRADPEVETIDVRQAGEGGPRATLVALPSTSH